MTTRTELPGIRLPKPRPTVLEALTLVMAQRTLLRVKRTPEQWTGVTLQPIIFSLMFTYLFGGAIAGNVPHYLPTIVPGLLVMAVISTPQTGVQLREDMDTGVFDRLNAPHGTHRASGEGAPGGHAALSHRLPGHPRHGLIMGYRPAGGLVAVAAAGILVIASAWAVSWSFAFFDTVARSASTVQGLSMIILFPLTFLSNALVSVRTLPGILQPS